MSYGTTESEARAAGEKLLARMKGERFITAPATESAIFWNGFKYSISPLKPAIEPILMAQKEYEGKPLDSILKHEIGAVNVDGCRIPVSSDDVNIRDHTKHQRTKGSIWGQAKGAPKNLGEKGRYPPNVAFDAEAAEALDEQSGDRAPGAFPKTRGSRKEHAIYGGFPSGTEDKERIETGSGGASRFFPVFRYCAKPSRRERDAGLDGERNLHPTVKPINLMRWLVRLVTREGQTVLDPFCGSGTTGIAAALEGREFLGIELDKESAAVARKRIEHWSSQSKQLSIFD